MGLDETSFGRFSGKKETPIHKLQSKIIRIENPFGEDYDYRLTSTMNGIHLELDDNGWRELTEFERMSLPIAIQSAITELEMRLFKADQKRGGKYEQ